MRQRTSLLTVATTAALMSGASTFALAQSKDAVSIADNDSVYIDGRSFKLVPGSAKGDASSQIKQLGARELGPGAIVFRAGDKLYIADAPPVLQGMSDRYGSDRYGSDRDTGVSAAQAERDWQEFLRQNRNRYGGDRYGSDRYGSDRDTSVSTAQAERDWQEFLRQNRNRYGSDRYGSDRDTSVSAAQAERDWQEFLRQNRNRYGSDRYGSDRDTSVSAAQAERDWQEFLRQNRNRYGSDRYGSDRYGSDRYGSDPQPQPVYINDPDYAQYKLKKAFDENWTTASAAR